MKRNHGVLQRSGRQSGGRVEATVLLVALLSCQLVATVALSRFDKATCAIASSAPASISARAGDGSWQCLSFEVQQQGAFVVPFLQSADAQLALEILLWNDARTSSIIGDGDTRWRDTAGPDSPSPPTSSSADNDWLLKFIPGMMGGAQVDFNGVSFTSNATRGGAVVSMDAIQGATTDNGNAGVYAWATGTNDVVLSPGFNYIQMLHPNRLESRNVASFAGKFMYRIHDLRAGRSLNNVRVGESTAGLLPALVVGQETTVQHLAMPEQDLTFKVTHEYAEAGYALQGFEYTVKYSGNGVGSLLPNSLDLMPPQGYSAQAGANLTFGGSSPLTAGGDTLYFNGTNTGKFGPTDGTLDTGFASDTTTVHKTWNVPLDVTAPLGSLGDFGMLVVPGPSMQQRAGATSMYDWSVQSSPFVDVAITVNSVTPYPLLSELSSLHLRNWGTDESNGHSVDSPATQEPFAIFRVHIDDPMWWRMRVHFDGVRDMNGADGVDVAAEMPPACQPLWEVQITRDIRFTLPSGSPPATVSGLRSNGYSGTWSYPRSAQQMLHFDWASVFDGSPALEDAHQALHNALWTSGLSGMTAVARAFVSRPLWLLVRVSALPRGYIGAGSRPDFCSSNNIMIQSASLRLDTVADECSSSFDCMVDSDGHPAEDRADDSANGDAARFSRCALQQGVDIDGRTRLMSKCMECTSHDHCLAGQYCHMDAGLAELGARSPDNTFARSYVADAESAALYGICREKSSDVLGKTCLSHLKALAASTPGMVHAVEGQVTSPVGGSRAQLSPGVLLNSANIFDVLNDDPSNDDFGEGSGGICGEYRFFNATGVSSVTFGNGGSRQLGSVSNAGMVRAALWTGFCDAERICRECVPGSTAGGSQAASGTVCLNGRMFSAQDVDGTVRSFTSNTAAGTQLGTTFMVILLIILFAVYMYVQARTVRHVHGLPAMSCCEVILCCGACSRLGPAPDASKGVVKPPAAPAGAALPEDVKPHVSGESTSKIPAGLTAAAGDADTAEAGTTAPGGDNNAGAAAAEA